MQQVLAAIDWFLNTSKDYRANEPTRRDELLALVQREIDACSTDSERAAWESRKALLERALEALLKWGLAYPFETVSLAFHAELFEPGLLTRVSLLGLDLVLALGHSRLCGVGRCALFDIGVSRG